MLFAIQSLYNKDYLKSFVRLDKYVTDTFSISCGVRQGDPMSPTLFAIYINDLIVEINSAGKGVRCGDTTVSALFYADDIVVLSESVTGLQTQLDTVNNWCAKWRLELNQDKTKIIHFRPKSVSVTKYKFNCGDLTLNLCEKYKYLGMYFNEHLDETIIISDVVKSATRALGLVISKYKNSGGLLYETFNTLYQACVQPVMLYGAALWGYKEYPKLNTIQNKACKFFLGVVKTASNTACHGDMGWLAVQAKQQIEMVRLWCRLIKMDKSRLTYKVFKWSHSLSLGLTKTWEYQVKQCLKIANISDIKISNDKLNVKSIMSRYREEVINIDKKKWLASVWDDSKNEEHGNKLRLYRCFKKDIYVEFYVTTSMPFHHRQSLAMLRTGCLPIAIETGRHHAIPLDERVCKLCNMQCIEDEVHFLLGCSLYDDLRYNVVKYVKDMTLSLKDQYCDLLSNPDIQAELGKYVFNSMKRRSLYI